MAGTHDAVRLRSPCQHCLLCTQQLPGRAALPMPAFGVSTRCCSVFTQLTRLELSCIPTSFARWMCNSSSRSQGRAITQTLTESVLSPVSGKTNKTSRLVRARQGIWFGFVHTSLLYCNASLHITVIKAIYMKSR